MNPVTSNGSTTIAFDRMGDGPPVILIADASAARLSSARFVDELARDFTFFQGSSPVRWVRCAG